MQARTPSKYQKEIYRVYNTTSKNIFISAGPGSGKTTTSIEMVNQTPLHKKIWMSAFNKSIAEELKSRVRPGVDVSTLHSKGISLLRANMSCKLNLKEIKTWIWGKQIFNHYLQKKFKNDKDRSVHLFTLSRMYDLYRMNLAESTEDSLMRLSDMYNVGLDEDGLEQTLKIISVIEDYNDSRPDEFTIDYTDMLWLPYKFLKQSDYPRYDVVFIDECLPYHMPVLLSDGNSLSIGEIVDKKLQVEVVTYNLEKKIQENKKVVGWSKTVNSKKLYKIRGHNKSDHNIRGYVVCTFNHKIYVKDIGFICAEDVKLGMVIQHETKAYKTQKYKIAKKGSKTLSISMIEKNKNPENRCNRLFSTFSPVIRGGNGRMNELQEQFLKDINRVSCKWQSEYVIVTDKEARSIGSPKHYKIDIACEELKIAIELDGASHNTEKARITDRKKDEFLVRAGWKVKRIKNRDLVKNYETIVEDICNDHFDGCYDGVNCIVDLIVDNIEEVEIKDKWVYDITVEDNHNFYANGILVHNCQDINPLQKRLIDNIIGKSGRFVAVGDERQAIYSFMGSNLDSLNAFKNSPNTVSLPLSVSYRCAKKIVEEANKVFPGIEPAENAPEGIVRYGSLDEIRPGDFVICRNNLPLTERYIDLLGVNKKSYILGKDFGKSLTELLTKVDKIDDLNTLLSEKKKKLEDKGVQNVMSNAGYVSLMEKCQIVRILYNRTGSLDKVKGMLEGMFAEDSEVDKKNSVVLSTIHKSKGLESDRIFILNPELIPSKYAQTELDFYQEKCLMYVAITRAKNELIIIRDE